MPRVTLDDPDGTLSLLRDSVAQFTAQHDGGRIFRAKRERAADLDVTVWTAMAQAGWTGLMLPETLGGSGLGMREQVILSEALGRGLIAEPLASAAVLSGVLIADAPISEERQRLGEGIADGRLIVTPAVQDSVGAWSTSARLCDEPGRRVCVERSEAVRGCRALGDGLPCDCDDRRGQRSAQRSRTHARPFDRRAAGHRWGCHRDRLIRRVLHSVGVPACRAGEACGALLDAARASRAAGPCRRACRPCIERAGTHHRLHQGSRAIRQADCELPVDPAPAGRDVDGCRICLRRRRQRGRNAGERAMASPPGSRCWRRRRGQAMPPSPSAGAPCTFMARWASPMSATSASTSSAPSI